MRGSVIRFSGARLREARLARGLTAAALADLVGLDDSAISHYENDRHSPSQQIMQRIADKLNMSTTFFTKPTRALRPDRLIFWRSRQAATQTQKARSIQRYYWLLDVVDFQSHFVEFPTPTFPALDLPSDPLTLTCEHIEEIAAAVRQAWSVGPGPIGNLVALLERRGTIVVRTPVDTEHLDAFSEWREDDQRPYIILGSDKDSNARSRFDAAHELGHMVMHRHVAERDFNKLSVHSLLEKQAMRFAGAFLLPAEMFADDLFAVSLDAFRELKPKWRVAISAMIHRAADLGLIDEHQAKKLWINMARRKWKKREPGDDEIEPERPALIRNAFDMLLDNGIVDPMRMEIELGFRVRDIESVAGLPTGYLEQQASGPLKFKIA